MKTYVVIPGYNEERYIGKVLDGILKVTRNIVYVDDGSTDSSIKIARKKLRHVLCHQINLGKGAALKTGCEYAFYRLEADAVIFMDADGQHDPQEIPRFWEELEKGAEMVFGVRNLNTNLPFLRKMGNKSASLMLNLLFGQYIPDIPSGYKALTKSTYNKIKWEASGYEVEIEIAAKVAINKIPYRVFKIDTLYYDPNKGMTEIDALLILKYLVQLRLEL